MNYENIIAFGVIGLMLVIFAGIKLAQYRRAFLVPEGYVGLLYHKGKFVEVLQIGRHIRWGRHYTVDAQDIRKTSLLVAGQDVLSADNVGLKLSLLMTYQLVDPAKAVHE